jgi:hypothetical protein
VLRCQDRGNLLNSYWTKKRGSGSMPSLNFDARDYNRRPIASVPEIKACTQGAQSRIKQDAQLLQIVKIKPEMVRATNLRVPRSSKSQKRKDRGENLVEQDIALLNRIANDSNLDLAARKRARLAAETLSRLLSDSNSLANVAKATGVDSQCRGLKDADLAELVANAALTGRRSLLYRALSRIAASHSECCDLSSEIHVMELALRLFELYSVALADELGRRQRRKEDPDGQLVRQILVEEEARGERIQEVANQRTRGLWFPHDRTDGGKDAASEMAATIWELLTDLAGTSPAAANPGALLAFMTGRLNPVLRRARDYVRNQIETADRRIQKEEPGNPLSLIPLVELLPSRSDPPGDLNRYLLVEQLRSRADLSALETSILRKLYVEGQTQKEAARSLRLSQSVVSKIKSTSITKLAKALVSQSDQRASRRR